MFTVNRNPSTRELRKFGLTMFVGFAVVGALAWCSAWWRTGDRALLGWGTEGTKMAAVALWLVGAVLGVVSFSPRTLARPVYVGWMTGVVKLGVAMSTVLLTVLFVVLLPLFSIVVRLGDPLHKRLSSDGTYWENYKPHEATLERMRRPF